MHEINSPWVLWYHSIKDKDWSKKSYRQIFKITDLMEMFLLHDITKPSHLQNGIFFLMREGIFPIWEDPENRNGCCISFKIPCSSIQKEWSRVITQCVTENILKNVDEYKILNGISISPKREFNIIKIWLRRDIKDYTTILKEYPPFLISQASLYKKNLT